MASHDEVKRIREVYAYYDSTAAEQRKREASNPGTIQIVRERERRLAALLSQFPVPLPSCRILDVGCGRGDLLQWFHLHGAPAANLYGIDLLPDRIEKARQLLPGANFECVNGEELEFPSETFDLVACSTVFSSIADEMMATRVAQNMARVLRPAGAILWYDFRYPNPSNPHTRPMRKKDVHKLFPGFEVRLQSISVLPPVTRRLGLLAEPLYPLLAAIPPLRSHLMGLLIKT